MHAWRADGSFLGEIVDNNYIMRRENMVEPLPKIPKIPPIHPIPPISRIDKIGRIPRIGWKDVLDEYK